MLENQLEDLEDKLFVATILYKKCVSFLSTNKRLKFQYLCIVRHDV